MCLLVVNPTPNKLLPHLIDVYPNIPDEFIVTSMKERSLLSTMDLDMKGGWVCHMMHPELTLHGYDIMHNRVGGEDSIGHGTMIVRDIRQYIERLTDTCPKEVLDESCNPCIQWSCSLLGIEYKSSGRVQWDIEFTHPRIYDSKDETTYIRALLPYNYPRLWELTQGDIVQYIIISLIINDNEYWTQGLKDRELYLKRTPFETKVYLLLDDMAPKTFKDKFMYWLRAVREYISPDYLMDAVKIMKTAEQLLTYEVNNDKDLYNEYDCYNVKVRKLYYSKPFNYI